MSMYVYYCFTKADSAQEGVTQCMIEETLKLPQGFLSLYQSPEDDPVSFLERAKGWLKDRFVAK
jgi:hypothetical protein